MGRIAHEVGAPLMARKRGIPGLSFSWKRAVGISAAKRRIAKATGIPTTRSGRQRKVGEMAGCAVVLAIPLMGIGLALTGYLGWRFLA